MGDGAGPQPARPAPQPPHGPQYGQQPVPGRPVLAHGPACGQPVTGPASHPPALGLGALSSWARRQPLTPFPGGGNLPPKTGSVALGAWGPAGRGTRGCVAVERGWRGASGALRGDVLQGGWWCVLLLVGGWRFGGSPHRGEGLSPGTAAGSCSAASWPSRAGGRSSFLPVFFAQQILARESRSNLCP